jgi:hypothetical protein
VTTASGGSIASHACETRVGEEKWEGVRSGSAIGAGAHWRGVELELVTGRLEREEDGSDPLNSDIFLFNPKFSN